ncbi:amidohydrolase [Bacilliculturomica massiliensis]|uniref:amidohydrolase n=1 Tax=Bacilliculturomica massiliensis TaxID=1917867 RepID=UPI0013EF24BA|nr:amidohydrolase [Bacilliculturomica massiliensis]
MKLYTNGKIASMDRDLTFYEAIGIEDGKICFLGSRKEAEALQAEELVDLGGKLMLPGFVDTHMHMLMYAFFARNVDLFGSRSVDEVISRFQEKLKSDPGRSYLYGMGWNQENFEGGAFPTRADLDRISTEIPIFAARICGHIAVYNSKALELLRASQPGAHVLGNTDFETGLVKEDAALSYSSLIPPVSEEELVRMILDAQAEMNRCGLTCAHSHDFAVMPGVEWKTIVSVLRRLSDEGKLTCRIFEQSYFPDDREFAQFLSQGLRTERGGDGFFRIGPRKIVLDGSLGGSTAMVQKGYVHDRANKGLASSTEEAFYRSVRQAHDSDCSVAVHCIGDEAMRWTLSAFQRCQKENPKPDIRHGIVHAQLTTPEIMEKMKELEVQVFAQPIFINADMEVIYDRIDGEDAAHTYNWKTMLDMGIHVSGGTDAPVEPFHVMNNLYAAITRKNLEGTKTFLPEQALSVEEAVRLVTSYAAWASFDEDRSGTLEVGKNADLVVLSENIFEIEPDRIKDVDILLTVAGGRTVYSV